MKVIESWQEEKDQYILNHGFMLKRADKLEFEIHETIYSNGQIIITRLRYMGLLLEI
ncbi:hypothetical protein [Desnuesiella massiliensis]|uniref:hypothetical protein n=1 Tax=Desnuesiella massiliensis TaxID=1650662 RepID=UPI001FA71E70|nr:hypothetical protein [Desnuesiella massiliensis]